jgi:HlyD family secretion protein
MSRALRICRSRFLRVPVVAALVLLVLVPFLVGNLRANLGLSPNGQAPLTRLVTRGDFAHDLLVKGEVASAVHTEVRCEVRSHRDSWLRILEVVPEGTCVEPGDFLIQLDSSGLEDERNVQQVVCEKAQAEVVRLRSVYEAAEIAKQDYLQGEYALERQDAELALFVARDRVRKAQQSLEASRKLEARGYITAQQLRADEYALQAAETDLRMAEVKLHVLEHFTKRKKLTGLDSTLAATKAQLAAAEANSKLSRYKLADIEDQIRKCTLRAPAAGTVVLAHLHHNGHSHLVEPGESTMERRVLVRLPDFRHMQVDAKVEEDKIAFVKPGLPATIRLEGIPEAELYGRVVKIDEYPDPEAWFDVKQYKTTVAIDAPLEGMRPGMTAEVTIHVRWLEDQLQVPAQAVLAWGDKSYCIAEGDAGWEACEVSLGPTNGMTTVIRSGLCVGQKVAMSPASFRDKVSLPDLPGKGEAPLHAPLAGL